MSVLDLIEVSAISLVDVPAVEEFAITKSDESQGLSQSFVADCGRGSRVAKRANPGSFVADAVEAGEFRDECETIERELKERDGDDSALLKRVAAIKKSLDQPERKGLATQTDGLESETGSTDTFVADAVGQG